MSKASKPHQKELSALRRMTDKRIDTSDAGELDWKSPVRGRFYKPIKQAVSLRLDADVVDWFKSRHTKYQTAVNAVLREYMEAQRKG